MALDRDLDRERMGLEQQEKKIIMDIKKMAKEGQMVRHRASISQINLMVGIQPLV